jgi:hypothetical protein
MTPVNDNEATRPETNRLEATQPSDQQQFDFKPVVPAFVRPYDGLPSEWKLFPCHYVENGVCNCGDPRCPSPGKHPRTRNGVKDATNDRRQLDAWWAANPMVNWALATGAASGVFVIDLDVKPEQDGMASFDAFVETNSNGEPVPTTVVADTGSGGRHIYLEHPGGVVGNQVNWLPGVDIRGDGGYVIIPPSSHLSGTPYSWRSWTTRPLAAPGYLLAGLRNGRSKSAVGPRPTAQRGTSVLMSTDDALQFGLNKSERNITMHRLACRWWGLYGLRGEHQVLGLARQVWSMTSDHETFPWSEAIKAVESARRFIEQSRNNDLDAIRAMIGGRK